MVFVANIMSCKIYSCISQPDEIACMQWSGTPMVHAQLWAKHAQFLSGCCRVPLDRRVVILMRRTRADQIEKMYRKSRGIPRTDVLVLNRESIG